MATSTIKAMVTSELATPNSAYVGYNSVYATKIGKLVNVAGRFTITTTKPSGQSNYLFSGLPIPKGNTIGFVDSRGHEIIINAEGHLTSNVELQPASLNVQFTYCEN